MTGREKLVIMMKNTEPSNRELRRETETWLRRGPDEKMPEVLSRQPGRRLINPLLSFLYNREPLLKWHAVTAIGRVVAGLAEEDLESARVVMRRLMWSLNDESGGIGWGAPETMGEIMARHQRLAREFSPVLVSYLAPKRNYLEYEALHPGLLWGLGRLARTDSALVAEAAGFLPPYLTSAEADIRGHAVWAATALDSEPLRPLLRELTDDKAVFDLYRNQRLERVSIGSMINL